MKLEGFSNFSKALKNILSLQLFSYEAFKIQTASLNFFSSIVNSLILPDPSLPGTLGVTGAIFCGPYEILHVTFEILLCVQVVLPFLGPPQLRMKLNCGDTDSLGYKQFPLLNPFPLSCFVFLHGRRYLLIIFFVCPVFSSAGFQSIQSYMSV